MGEEQKYTNDDTRNTLNDSHKSIFDSPSKLNSPAKKNSSFSKCLSEHMVANDFMFRAMGK